MQSPAGQRSAARGREKLSIGRLRRMQVFLSFLVIRIEPQCFTKLDHRLRDLALSQVKFAQVIVSNSQLRVRPQRSQIMQLGSLEISVSKKRVGKSKLGVRVIGLEL